MFAALVGKVDFDVQRLESSVQPYTTDFNLVTSRNPCLPTNQGGTATRVSVLMLPLKLIQVHCPVRDYGSLGWRLCMYMCGFLIYFEASVISA